MPVPFFFFFSIQEFLTILSKVSRGSVEEKLQWIFGLYDLDGDGLISKEEMLDVVGSIYEMLGRYTQPQIVEPHLAAREHVDRIFHVSIGFTFFVKSIHTIYLNVIKST